MLNTESRKLLRTLIPSGLIATKAWLQVKGLNPHFVDNAVKSGTLISLKPGVYTRETEPLQWKGVMTSLQRMQEHPVHVGGLTALELEGLAHYQSRGKLTSVQIYSEAQLPAWLNKLDINTDFDYHGTRKIWPQSLMYERKFLREEVWHESLPALRYSGPEKAILEVLNDVPKKISFEHADQLMQGLSTLSPRKIDALLRACSSIKAKRLFMWLAERHNHAWLKHLQPEAYDFGAGKRELARSGRLDSKWNITVPKEM
ncbi:type IV toxin-antitoxin system AbiEi family antitoxin [Pantoea trifolii]|uniref:type IV toxin-antitoxin system AbiEi family antitoxin n=1 Tax=Candidatus Pantoea symbiotica TaxID=1884370 RepID=UPI00077BE711|nr:type IV toxin-antitoxin system AbiEi family antitoxin [Pantoea rodasii]MDY0926902.1 type IV toxin-antitoxin system AbiEi family antitoxin domain-containing protein [Enterobacter sp. CFBP8995]